MTYPFSIPSGTNLVPEASGVNQLGTPSYPFATGYFNNAFGPGFAKAWVSFSGSTPPTIYSAYNVSTVVRTNTGKYNIIFQNPMINNRFATIVNSECGNPGSNGRVGGLDLGAPNPVTTTGVAVILIDPVTGASVVDTANMTVMIMGL